VTGEADPADSAFCYLTTTGRRSGAPHRIQIWFALYRGTVYVLSGGRDRSDWVRNLMASPDVLVEIEGDTVAATARVVVAGTEEDALARQLLVEKYRSEQDDLAAWGRTSLPIAIERSAAGR
jgi:deazaflavin-dependent oxidoreductase (nitroreductase family)